MSKIYVVNEKKDVDVLSVILRCRKCGNQWKTGIGASGEVSGAYESCFKCLAKESEKKARENKNVQNQ